MFETFRKRGAIFVIILYKGNASFRPYLQTSRLPSKYCHCLLLLSRHQLATTCWHHYTCTHYRLPRWVLKHDPGHFSTTQSIRQCIQPAAEAKRLCDCTRYEPMQMVYGKAQVHQTKYPICAITENVSIQNIWCYCPGKHRIFFMGNSDLKDA